MIALAEICRDVIEEALRQHEGVAIELNDWDEAFGNWDREQVAQIVRLLLSNALVHGGANEPVLVSVIDSGDNALLAIASSGAATDTSGPTPVVVHVSLPKFASRTSLPESLLTAPDAGDLAA
jgi:signal transduction histidine kinase